MAAGIYNFICEQGTDWQRIITVRNSSGTVVNLTGYTARMHVRKNIGASTPLIELTTSNGRIVLGGTSGTLTLNLSATETSGIAIPGVYDIELVSSTGAVSRLLQGEFRLDKEVTR